MKKILIVYGLVLAGVFALLSFLARDSRFVFERKLWHLNQKLESALKDPKSAPDNFYKRLENEYQLLIQRYQSSPYIPMARMAKAQLYLSKKAYPKARQALDEIIVHHAGQRELASRALFAIAKTYEFEKNDARAEFFLQRTLKEYPETATGMMVPFYGGKYYEQKGDLERSVREYGKAVQHYKAVIESNEGITEFYALRFLGNTYAKLALWQDSIDTFETLLIEHARQPYFTLQRVNTPIKMINAIGAGQLKDVDIPVRIFRRFRDRYPQHPLSSYLKNLTASLLNLEVKMQEYDLQDF